MSNIESKFIDDAAISTQKIEDGAVDSNKLATGAVTANAITADSITGAKIRLDNDQYLRARNVGGTADINLLKLNTTNQTVLNLWTFPLADGANGQVLATNASGILSWTTLASGGISQLTGEVTAGPGTGSQTATIASNAITTVKINADAVTGEKIRLNNNQPLRARNNANSADVNLINLDVNDEPIIQSANLQYGDYTDDGWFWGTKGFGLLIPQTSTTDHMSLATEDHGNNSTDAPIDISIQTGYKPGTGSTGVTGALWVTTGQNAGSGASGHISTQPDTTEVSTRLHAPTAPCAGSAARLRLCGWKLPRRAMRPGSVWQQGPCSAVAR